MPAGLILPFLLGILAGEGAHKTRKVMLGPNFNRVRQANMREVVRLLPELEAHRNVKAFLRVIRQGETGKPKDDAAYRLLVFGGEFESFADHPRILKARRDGRKTSAAGAYQITATTWDETRRLMGLPDFSPANQDRAAIGRLAYRGALPAALDGDIAIAAKRVREEWTSLPGGTEQRMTLSEAQAWFSHFGGLIKTGR